jgi:hypothetical protein
MVSIKSVLTVHCADDYVSPDCSHSDGGDKIHAKDSGSIDGIQDKRDSSFVRVRCTYNSLLELTSSSILPFLIETPAIRVH